MRLHGYKKFVVMVLNTGTKFCLILFVMESSNMHSRDTLAKIVRLMKTRSSFEIRTILKAVLI